MPSMPRIPGLPKEVAEKILGLKPPKKKKHSKKIDQQLTKEETIRIR